MTLQTYRSEHNQRRLLPAHPGPPPPAKQSADGARQREGGDVVHADGDGDAAGDEGVPARAGRAGAQRGRDGEQDGGAQRPLLRHGREALARDEAGREDPDVPGRDLEQVAWYLVDSGFPQRGRLVGSEMEEEEEEEEGG